MLSPLVLLTGDIYPSSWDSEGIFRDKNGWKDCTGCVCIHKCICVCLYVFLMFSCLYIDNSSFLYSPPQPSRRFFPPPMPLSKPGENGSLILYITHQLLKIKVVVSSEVIQDTKKCNGVNVAKSIGSIFAGYLPFCVFSSTSSCRKCFFVR